MSDTVIPTESTARTSALPAQAGAATASIRTAARAPERRPHIIASAEPLPQVIAHPERVRHDGERGVHRAARGEEARVDDVEVVDVVGLQCTSSAEVFGSVPKRTVPFWCATPASGMRPAT